MRISEIKDLALAIGASFLFVGCSGPSNPAATSTAVNPAPPAPLPPPIEGLPVSMTVKQRSTTNIPGSDSQIRLTVDDITRGQVMTSLAMSDGAAILSPVSLAISDSATFRFKDATFVLKLAALDNALIGEDFATLEITAADGTTLTEEQKIEKLLQHVEGLQNATFLRNGGRHTPKEAADHLRTKWASIGEKGMTAKAFIDQTAARSSLTGDPYEIVLANGSTVPAAGYLHEQLREIEKP